MFIFILRIKQNRDKSWDSSLISFLIWRERQQCHSRFVNLLRWAVMLTSALMIPAREQAMRFLRFQVKCLAD